MRSLIIAATFAAFSTSAMAADVVYDEPPVAGPMAPQVYDWNGFYAGLNAGYGFGGDAAFSDTFGPLGTFDLDGFVAGGQVGYNWQMNSWVFGVEADIQYSDISAGASDPLTTSFSNDLDYFGTVRGRVGYAFDNVLPYVTGGFAYGRNDLTVDYGFVTLGDRQNHTGWTAGAGVEYGVTDAISLKLEYLYTDLGSETYFSDQVNPIVADIDFHTVRAGINFRF